jgi:protein Mpv17
LTWTVFINCGFFWTTTVMETGDSAAGFKKIEDKLWPTLKVNWVVWPVLQAVNLSVVPLPFRILYINFCSLFWSAYLSSQTNTPALPAPVAGELK